MDRIRSPVGPTGKNWAVAKVFGKPESIRLQSDGVPIDGVGERAGFRCK